MKQLTELKWNNKTYAELSWRLDEKTFQLIMRDTTNDDHDALRIIRSHYLSIKTSRVLTLYEQLTSIDLSETEAI